MAVELIVKNIKTGRRELIAIATQEAFRTYWLKACGEMGFQVIPKLEDAILEKRDIELLLKELLELRGWFQRNLSSDAADGLTARVNQIIGTLGRVLRDPDLTTY